MEYLLEEICMYPVYAMLQVHTHMLAFILSQLGMRVPFMEVFRTIDESDSSGLYHLCRDPLLNENH